MGFATFIRALVVHALSAGGSLGHHLRAMSGVDISDAAAHERRQGLGWDWFESLFETLLQPLAQRREHTASFYHGLRLVGMDGTQWSLRNAPAITRLPRRRHDTGQGHEQAAFLKWGCAVLVELGTHQPLAAACASLHASKEEGELTLARRLLGALGRQQDTLLLADRCYGRGSFIADVLTTTQARCQMLVRVSEPHQARVLELLGDGSALVEVRVRKRGLGSWPNQEGSAPLQAQAPFQLLTIQALLRGH